MKDIIIYGESFNVRKDSKKEWEFYHVRTGARLNSHYLKIEAIIKGKEILSERGETETKKAIKALVGKRIKNRLFNRECIKRLFKNTFGAELHSFRDYSMYLISNELCIDLVRFDRYLNTPNGVSCRDYIDNKYGSRALKLVNILM